MDDVDYVALTEKLGNAVLQNKQLKRANINKDKTIKHLRRVVRKLKEEAAKERKPHYRNGRKRGRNGRNG